MKFLAEQNNQNRRIYWAVVSVVALSCGSRALAQSDAGVADSSTNSVAAAGSSTNVTELGNYTVIGKLNQARNSILPDLGATAYTHTADQIQMQSQGENATFNQVILRSPGVAEDSAVNGDLHVRGEHANLQYRINGVLLPEGIAGFGLELDPRFVESMQLITGSLPAEYGFRTAGVVDVKTKSGMENGGDVDMYGGSFGTYRPSFEYGGTSGKWQYFMDGSYDHTDLGIENPTVSHDAIHDAADEEKAFMYASYLIDDTSRVTLMGSASYSNFQVPNTPGLPVGTAPGGNAWNGLANSGLPSTFGSSDLNEQQREQNYYGVATYQKSAGDFNMQISAFGRASGQHFQPDSIGDLYFNGVASDVEKDLYSGGAQLDASYELSDNNTIRGGAQALDEVVFADSSAAVFPLDPVTLNPNGPPRTIVDNHRLTGLYAGGYLQDEWKFLDHFTLNYGARFDVFNSSFDNEWQISPRANLIYQPWDSTMFHAGYSRYFTPPPVEDVSGSDIALFNGTSNQSSVQTDGAVKAERSNYFDIGVSQKLAPGLQVGLDGYYKQAHNQLDDGLFGQTLMLSAFNYLHGRVYGVEATASYTHGGFNAYANLAYSEAEGEDWSSAQFLFNPTDQAYVQNHWIYLDHDQRVSSTFGVSYTWKEGDHDATSVYSDVIYGSGLRQTGTNPTAYNIPNGESVPDYWSINVGVEQRHMFSRTKILKARLDVVNLADNIYELRSGNGVGVNAAQYGERLGFFGSVSFMF